MTFDFTKVVQVNDGVIVPVDFNAEIRDGSLYSLDFKSDNLTPQQENTVQDIVNTGALDGHTMELYETLK
jgi:hypothetical protein